MPRPTWSRADFGWRAMAAENTSVAGSNARSCTQVVSPVEQVILGRVHVRGALILLGRRDEIARTLFDVAEQVMELTSLLRAQHPSDLLTRGV